MLPIPKLGCLQVFQFNSALPSGQVCHIAFVLNWPGLYSSVEMFLKIYSLKRKTRDYKKCWHYSHPKWIFLNYPITCLNSPWKFDKESHSDGVALSRKRPHELSAPKRVFCSDLHGNQIRSAQVQNLVWTQTHSMPGLDESSTLPIGSLAHNIHHLPNILQ